ncbi:predicted protein [Plenodomus lingam JN3]|uniref:Predicted protein n=1 Tax=Leptosphaeria maculans (strain JN3 / isolate v23.1.3 / race Av1-4-5-6-7-8) TaxID=985895 RepID=E5A9B5_LEPMJ|nr:predicted protein [Plenodomus lingam JN3]CBY00256.1 predicted protein [Plenodomus lingam JN3]
MLSKAYDFPRTKSCNLGTGARNDGLLTSTFGIELSAVIVS